MNTPEGFGKIETKEDTVPLQDYLDVVNSLYVANQKIAYLEVQLEAQAQLQDKQPPPQPTHTRPSLFKD